MRLTDVVCDRPRILFVGINPGLRSGQTGHHFAGRGNPFWRLLHASGLTPMVIAPEDDQQLADHRLALTNLCPRATRSADELTRDELERGSRALRAKIRRLRPEVVALVGITLYGVALPAIGPRGPGAKPELVEGARVFVVPNPSGLNAAFPGFENKLVWFRRLRRFSQSSRARAPARAAPPPRASRRPAAARASARSTRASAARRSR